jgi:signal transduction histidine kinase
MVAELRSLTVSLIALASLAVPTTLLVTAAAGAASPQRQLTAVVGSAVFYMVIDVLAWGIGRGARRYRLRMAHLQEQHTLQVQEQREAAENAVSAERLRIARELHDIVAHSVTIMVLHAAGAKRVVDTNPARAKEALATIEESGQQAMGELRRLLELLRENEGDPPRSGSPLPGLQQVAQTINSVRTSGVEVAFEVHGEPRRLDTSVDLAAYRLVQEALTNVTKHRGAGARATVTIDWGVDKLTVAVQDDGGGAAASESIMDAAVSRASSLSTGNGLAGLRERIAIAGGDFVAAPTDAGGFRVAARLPLSGSSAGVVGSATPPDGQDALPSTDGRHPAGTPLAWIDP